MHALRLIPALVLFILVQVGLHRALCGIFFLRIDQAHSRRRLGWAMGLATLILPLQIAAIRSGIQIPAALRWSIFEPLLAWLVLALPLSLILGIMLTVARRWPRPKRARASVAEAVSAIGVSPRTDSQYAAELPTAPEEASPLPKTLPPEPMLLPENRRVFLVRSARLLVGGAMIAAGRGVYEAEELPQITRLEIPLRGLHQDLDGLTILQLSDIHSGALITEERMRSFAAIAASLNAEVIVFTGDLLDGSGRAAAPFTRAFENLHGKLGTFAILGNHDYYAGERFAMRAVRDAGQVLLRNSGARISKGRGSLWLGGVDDPLIRDAGGEVDPKRAFLGAAPEEAKIMLAHRPGLFDLCAAHGAQLVLSGHTHGGQLALSPRFTPARLLGPHTFGHYQVGEAQLYVHRGMGVVGAAPIRLGVPPELALLTLRRV